MRKILLIFFICTYTLIYSQTENDDKQSIELPDFVITGVQSVNIPIQKKPKPKLIKTLSKEFFNPKYSPEEFLISNFSSPIKKDVNYFTAKNPNSGKFYVAAGINTQPEGEFYFNQKGKNVLFNTKVWGKNIRDFEDYSDFNESGGFLSTNFFINNDSEFLPGLQIDVDGTFVRKAYKFFASSTPDLEREATLGKGSLAFANNLNSSFRYNFGASYSQYKLSDLSLKENLLTAKANFVFDFDKLAVGLSGKFVNQNLSEYIPDISNSFLTGEAYLHLKTTKSFQAKIGAHYSKQDSSNYFSPIASLSAKFSNNFSFLAEYKPYAKFNTIQDLVMKNMYANIGTTQNVFTKNKNNARVTFVYQYDKYFELSFGGGYTKIDNFVFGSDFLTPGKFSILTINNVERISGFFNMFFHLGPLGELYSNTNYNDVKSENDNYLPYEPKITSDLIYAHKISNKLLLEAGANIAFEYYSDLANTNKMDNSINLFGSLGYDFIKGLTLKVTINNILNRDNYRFINYKNTPMDILGGVEYRW